MDNSLDVDIRQFKESDLNQVTDIISTAFLNKFQKTISLEGEELSEFLVDLGIIPSTSFSGYFIAEINNRIVAVLILSWKKQKIPKKRLSYLKLIMKYGWGNVVDTSMAFLYLNIKPKKDVCFFKSMAVTPDMQGKGIAAKLASYAIDFSRKKGFNKIVLRIASSNKKAINHIERLDFKRIKEEKLFYSKIFFDIEDWYLYELNL